MGVLFPVEYVGLMTLIGLWLVFFASAQPGTASVNIYDPRNYFLCVEINSSLCDCKPNRRISQY